MSQAILHIPRNSRVLPILDKTLGHWDNTHYYILFKLNLYSKIGVL